jgi:hypothetical protein
VSNHISYTSYNTFFQYKKLTPAPATPASVGVELGINVQLRESAIFLNSFQEYRSKALQCNKGSKKSGSQNFRRQSGELIVLVCMTSPAVCCGSAMIDRGLQPCDTKRHIYM